jgi:putative ABC transport system ATP-binding protein
MDLLLQINQVEKVTCIMVTHNPDLECYADRILYVRDGRFERQSINREQTRIDYDSYMQYLDTL